MMRQYGGVVAAPPFTGNLHKYIIMELHCAMWVYIYIYIYTKVRLCECVIKFAWLAEKSFYESKTQMERGLNGRLSSLSVANFDALGVKSFGSDFTSEWIIKSGSCSRFTTNLNL